MELGIVENALDSIEFGQEFYIKYMELGDDKYNSHEIRGYLKMVVICFHHSIELFNKKLLMDIDPKSIVKEESYGEYNRAIEDASKKGIRFDLERVLISDAYNIKTIDYTTTLNSLGDVWNLANSDIKKLKKLGETRNKLMHVGLDALLDFYEVIKIINDAITLILDFYWEKISKSYPLIDRYYVYIFENLEDLLDEGIWIENETWEIYYQDNFLSIYYIAESLLEKDFVEEINELGYSVDLDLEGRDELFKLDISINDSNGELLKEICAANIARKDVTILKEKYDDIILFIINHEEMLLKNSFDSYIYRNFRGFKEPLDYTTSFWESHVTRKQDKCVRGLFSEEVLQNQMKKYLNHLTKLNKENRR